MDRLPDEVLEEIFSYCTFQDLVWNIPDVNSHWRLISSRSKVWKYHTYCPGRRDGGKEIIAVLKRCPKLQAVDFRKRVFGKEVFEVLANNCSDLVKLFIDYFQDISCEILSELQRKCPRIEYLDVNEEILSHPEKLEIIGQFMNLRTLSSKRSICNVSLKPIADGCPRLECLETGEISVEFDDLSYFLSKKKDTLRTLVLPCSVSRGSNKCTIPLLSVCTALESLCIHWNCENESESLVQALGNLKNLKSLTWQDLHFSTTDDDMRLFGNKNLAHLVRLELCSFSSYNDAITKIIVENCPQLQALHLSICAEFTDKTLEMIVLLKNLRELGIYGNRNVTDNGIKHLLNIEQLECLLLGCCDNLTAISLNLLTNFSHLQILKFRCQSLRNSPWHLFADHLKSLKHLEIYRCQDLNVVALKALKKKMPHVTFSVDLSQKKARYRKNQFK
ncbi:F-box/LRR-repeat protein 2 [Anabrus simplex]|uniref:F-box/LRR-repeat protein 2 n=1 Tax=Anabrus simplex TaxID=316456 RepID=UPI0035A2A9CF